MKIRVNLFYSGCVATDVEVENEDEVYEKKDDFFETVTDEDIADAVSYDDWTYDILDEREWEGLFKREGTQHENVAG